MPSMFPGMVPSPDDPNRGPRRTPSGADPGTWPGSLKWGYYVSVAAAMLMVVTGMIGLAQDHGATPDVSAEVIAAFHRNVRFIGVYNIIAGLTVAALAAQLRSGGRISRRILVGVFALSIFFNIAAFAIQVSGLAAVVICVLLGVAAVMIFRPDANAYIARMSSSND
ncbi:hypothetical protein B842_01470 [Corynebacterium humireducens NBRC 106098 = DSM 45392]|uniref:Tellurium resistance protein TerC n=1 Tax=Corynebacterium humireducens NBRC 106098 = DSM 45392 TaxID=1223515 RepID=A0A0B5D007_9CORY|nr:hypothetical protein [Corynebacterium humireducens]AJE32150.1 hypothetical protein B842_01470 [Corynebacterium humireducens NBRC 106098 = DSM 45392]